MYIPKHFHVQDPAALLPLMERFNFAILVTADAGVPFATHIPLQIESNRGEKGSVLGHVARANPQWRHFSDETETLLIFQGDHAYVSPSWYESHPNVPTWNYIVVHAYGIPRIVEDEAMVRAHLGKLVELHEAGFETPWNIDAVDDYVRKLMRGIVAFEITITRLEGKFKLSQNKTQADRLGVTAALAASERHADQALARAMEEWE